MGNGDFDRGGFCWWVNYWNLDSSVCRRTADLSIQNTEFMRGNIKGTDNGFEAISVPDAEMEIIN